MRRAHRPKPVSVLFGPLLAAALALAAPAIAQQGPLPVDVATPLAEEITEWDEYTGQFEAVDRVELRARISGYLEKINFRDGQLVEKGDVLYLIDPRETKAAFERLKAELQAARAQQTLADEELRRGEVLVERRTLPVSALDERRAAKLNADAQVAVAQAALREAALDVEFTEVIAPISGRISESRISIGNLVTAGETILATLVSVDPIHLVFTATEADYLRYIRLDLSGDRTSSREKANPVEARLLDEDDWAHRGWMDFVDNEFNRGAGTITGRAIFDNPEDLFSPGLFARLRLRGKGPYEALLVPEEAILSDQAQKIVMTVTADGTVVPKVVGLGPLHRGLRVIKKGLGKEDRVIVKGVQRARPGGKVAPNEVALTFPEPVTN